MQNAKLIIKNFFTLKDITINLGKYNVFIGEQASGKSLILKSLFFFKSILFAPIKFYNTPLDELNNMFIDLFCGSFGIRDFNLSPLLKYQINDYEITVSINNGKVIINYNQNLIDLYNEKREFLSKQNKNIQDNQSYPDIMKYSILSLEIKKSIESTGLGVESLSRFLPAGRMAFFTFFNNIFNIVNNDKLNLNSMLINFGQDHQKAFAEYPKSPRDDTKDRLPLFYKFVDEILKGKYVYDIHGGYIQHDGFQTRLADASSGQQEFMPVYMILHHYLLSGFQKGSLYIEEPEAHLYPTAQKNIIELLTYVANVTNSDGLYMTTHSPYILMVLNNLIMANEVKDKQTNIDKSLLVPFEDVQAYFIDNGNSHSLMDEEYRIIDTKKLYEISDIMNSEYSEMLDLL